MTTPEWIFLTAVACLKFFNMILTLAIIDKPRKPLTAGAAIGVVVSSIIGFAILTAVLVLG